MAIQLRLFAGAQDLIGKEFVELPLDFPATIREIRQSISEKFPQLNPLLQHSRIAVDLTYHGDGETIVKASEIALIPPVSGG